MAERLGGADQLTEQAFLSIGEQVWNGRRQSAEMAGQAEISLQTSEVETVEQTVARLQLLTERSSLWLADARDQSRTICNLLKALERDAEALSLRGLAKVVKTLQALRVATRIEAARSHGHGAQVLSLELQHLASLMQEKIEHIFARCEVLTSLCRRAMALEKRAQSGPLQEADVEIRQTRALLVGVAEQCVRTTDHSKDIHQCSTELAVNFAELVAALQFQDITRQRLQHIRETLEDVAAKIIADPGALISVGEVCLLQHDQLQWAIVEFCQAITRLDENLRGMATGVRDLADDACAALFAGSREQCARISPALQSVTSCLENVQTTHLAAGQAMFAVCRAVRDVASLSVEIEQLGEEMQLLAQNAVVSAAHGKTRAAGLTVIAGSIQDLAEEAGRYAVAMVNCCRQVSDQADGLDARDQRLGDREANLEALLEEARTLTERLEEGSHVLDAHIATIGRKVTVLAENIEVALTGLEVRRHFLAQVEPVVDQLRSLAQEHGMIVRDDQELAMLDGIRSRYTMKSERDVHQRFLKRQEEPVAAAGMPVVDANSLGDNVELF